ncbi:MAG TPA: glutathione S-transferase N-terminal domain-containing protein [Polyangiaceae bacterium]|jgi:GST-like protein|nr:glutathione S-transferase N-terminal domain-containing protein [Polyangiaceae bacterium]
MSGIEVCRMLDLYTWRTPNGKKAPILLAELGWPFELHLINLGQGEQRRTEYLAINPNGKIPALVDTEGLNGELVVVFESGAILEYLADKAGQFLPREQPGRAEVLSWAYWQVGGPGPFFAQMLAFAGEHPRNDDAFEKFFRESQRLVRVLEGRLRDREWIAGPYSIADIMNYPWFAAVAEGQPAALEGAQHVQRWIAAMAARPAVQKGMAVGSDLVTESPTSATPR